MAVEVREFACTIPHGTAIATPYTKALTFPPRVVTQIDWRVPPGPNGQVGFAIGSSGEQVVPIDAGSWLIADDQDKSWPLTGFWDSGGWEFFGYNLGVFDHTVYLTFLCDLPQAPPAPPATPVASPNLNGTVAVGSTGNAIVAVGPGVSSFIPPVPVPTASESPNVPAFSGFPPPVQ